MQWSERMVGQRGAVVELVRQRLVSQAAAAEQLEVSVRQVRR